MRRKGVSPLQPSTPHLTNGDAANSNPSSFSWSATVEILLETFSRTLCIQSRPAIRILGRCAQAAPIKPYFFSITRASTNPSLVRAIFCSHQQARWIYCSWLPDGRLIRISLMILVVWKNCSRRMSGIWSRLFSSFFFFAPLLFFRLLSPVTEADISGFRYCAPSHIDESINDEEMI